MTAITWEIPAAQVLTLNRLPRDRHALDARKRRIRALADRQLPAMTWPGVTVHLDPDTKRATIRNAHTGKTADLPLRRLPVDSAATTILTHCKEN